LFLRFYKRRKASIWANVLHNSNWRIPIDCGS